jgi:hypothetical protein
MATYCPDPARSAWAKQDHMLKRQGVPKRRRPPQPPRRPAYPSKAELALKLVAQFWQSQPMVKIKCVLADALYGAARFMDAVAALFGGVQVISQLRCNQKVRFRNRTLSVSQYFAGHPGVYHTPCGSEAGIPSPRAWVARASMSVPAHATRPSRESA